MSDATQQPGSSRLLTWFVGIGLVVAIIGVILLIRGQQLPALDQARLDAAKSTWAENRVDNYQVAIAVSGRQPGVYEVSVKQGIAIEAKLDGRDLKRPRTFGTWSVDGMFETISRDLENQTSRGNLVLGAEFDETFGVPLRYKRIEMQTGVQHALQWEVTSFSTP